MLEDYSSLDKFSIITYTGSEINYDEVYETLRRVRQAGTDFSAEIQVAKNKASGKHYVRNTLIFIKTDDIPMLREHLHGKMKADYVSSAGYTLSPACIFRLAVGYGINKVYCDRDELAIGKIFMKVGAMSSYIFVSPEIREIANPDGTISPVLFLPVYGTHYKKSTRPTKTRLNASGIVVRGGDGKYLKPIDTGTKKAATSSSRSESNSASVKKGCKRSRAFVSVENLQGDKFLSTKNFALKRIFDSMEAAGSLVKFEMWEFQSNPSYRFNIENTSKLQHLHEMGRMTEILTKEMVRVEGPADAKEIACEGIKNALKEYFQLNRDDVLSEDGTLHLLVINNKEHDKEKIYDQTKHLLTQHFTIEALCDDTALKAPMLTCLRCLCIRHDLYTSRLTLIQQTPENYRTFVYGAVEGDVYKMTVSEENELQITHCRRNAYAAVRKYLRSMQADRFMALEDSNGHVFAIRETGQPAIPPVRANLSDYNNRKNETKEKIAALYDYSWSVRNGNFYYISGTSQRPNRSPRNYPHVYEIHPVNHSILPDPEEIFQLMNVAFVKSAQEGTALPWGFKYLTEWISVL